MSIAGILVSVVVRGLGSGIQFLAFILAAHLLMPEQFGVFQVAFSIITSLVVLSKFGLESKLMARIGGEIGKSFRVFTEYEQIVLMIVLVFSCFISFLYKKIVEIHDHELDGGSFFISANYSVLVVLLSTLSIIGSILRATGKPNKSNIVELLIPYGLLTICLMVSQVVNVEKIFTLMLICFSISIIYGFFGLFKLSTFHNCIAI